MASILVRYFAHYIIGLYLLRVLPVAGGFFTGRYSSPDDEVEAGSRFDLVRGQGEVSSTYSLLLLALIST
jgi:hypothetical protein